MDWRAFPPLNFTLLLCHQRFHYFVSIMWNVNSHHKSSQKTLNIRSATCIHFEANDVYWKTRLEKILKKPVNVLSKKREVNCFQRTCFHVTVHLHIRVYKLKASGFMLFHPSSIIYIFTLQSQRVANLIEQYT